ncbi:MAG: DUF4143 domain-containing protein [Firmicutes bacterium]|nr:DUF4143 domain-containing protein [Bacillota bacterium]
MYIKRHIEETINNIAKRKGVVILTGARQVGKSTMLRRTFNEHEYITLNKPSEFMLAKENPSVFLKSRAGKVIIDEIQKAQELFEYIKEDIDEVIFNEIDAENKTYGAKYILTGSQSFRLMKNVTESLAGRAGIVQMAGLSRREINKSTFREPFLPTHGQLLKKKDAPALDYNKTAEQIHRGSYPEMNSGGYDSLAWSNFYESYVKTYIEKDVREIVNIQNEVAFMKFLYAVASRTGQELNLLALGEVCGKEINTVKSWLSVLEASGLVVLVQPYYNNATSRMIKTPKMYMLDTGLVCYLGGWDTPKQMTNGAMWGAIFETYVASEIFKSYYNSGNSSPKIYFYRDKDKREIDLIIEEANVLYPIEIKASADLNKAMCSCFHLLSQFKDKQAGNGAVICMTDKPLQLTDTVWAINVELI